MIEEWVGALIVKNGRVLLQQPWPRAGLFTWDCPGKEVNGNMSHHETIRFALKDGFGVFREIDIQQQARWCGSYLEQTPKFRLWYLTDIRDGWLAALSGQSLGWFTAKETESLLMGAGTRLAIVGLPGLK